MRGDTHFTPERTALKTARTVSASFVAVTNFTPAVWHSLMASTTGKLLIPKFGDKSF